MNMNHRETAKERLALALVRPADYGTAFTKQVAGIAEALAHLLGNDVRHDRDMNYRSGQFLFMDLPHSSSVPMRLVIAVSSKERLFALRVQWLRNQAWTDRKHSQSHETTEAVSSVRTWFASHNYLKVDEETQYKLVPGATTEMDGAPATVFDIVFGEHV